jgi:hypothetical protein
MYHLAHELEILSRIIKYKNLTQAADHVGLTQPHLSRVIRKLESELGVPIMERSNKRKPEWSPHAPRLVQIFESNRRNLTYQISDYLEDLVPRNVRVGCLEGMVPFVTQFISKLIESYPSDVVELVVFDVAKLERRYLMGQLEFLFNIKVPGKGHHDRILEIGYQELANVEKSKDVRVCSEFEYSLKRGQERRKKERYVVSNSLTFRQEFLDVHGGFGRLPSEIQQQKPKRKGDFDTVFLIGSKEIPEHFWEETEKLARAIPLKSR